MGEPIEDLLAPTQPVHEGLLERLMQSFRLGTHHLVLALEGSSPELMQTLMQAGVRVLYLEPHAERSKAASSKGIPIRHERLDRSYALLLREEGLRADVVLANQLLSHSSDLNGLLDNLGAVLKDSDSVVMELPYVRELLEARQFEHFNHQQQHYFSVSALHELVRRHGLWLQRVEALSQGYRATTWAGPARLNPQWAGIWRKSKSWAWPMLLITSSLPHASPRCAKP
jgi:hypothetical protein